MASGPKGSGSLQTLIGDANRDGILKKILKNFQQPKEVSVNKYLLTEDKLISGPYKSMEGLFGSLNRHMRHLAEDLMIYLNYGSQHIFIIALAGIEGVNPNSKKDGLIRTNLMFVKQYIKERSQGKKLAYLVDSKTLNSKELRQFLEKPDTQIEVLITCNPNPDEPTLLRRNKDALDFLPMKESPF